MTSRHVSTRSLLSLLLMVCLAGCAGGSTAVTSAPVDTRPAPGPGVTAAELDAAMAAARSAGGDPRRIRVLEIAMSELGKKYEWGGNGPDSWDCSGLVKHAYAEVGVELPRVTTDQVREGVEVTGGKYEPADLLFYNKNGHIAMYIDSGLIIHAIGRGVTVEQLSKRASRISAVRRVLLSDGS